MRINITPMREERDVLDHRRTRLREILDLGLVAPEMQAQLRVTLAEVDRRIESLGREVARPDVREAA